MNLKPLATKIDILDGQVSLWLLPFSSLHSQLIVDQINEQFPDSDNWVAWMHYFQIFEAFVVDAKFKKSDNAHVNNLQHYWQNRNGSIEQRVELFPQAVSRQVQPLLFQAYLDTRESLPGVSEELAAGKPDKADDPEKKSTGDGGKQ